MISAKQASVLRHTSDNGRYVTDECEVIEMAVTGLLLDYGPQRLAGGAHYLTLTSNGRAALNEYEAAQPKSPKSKVRRRSPQFQAWRDYLEATYDRMSFPDFLKEVWPQRRHYV